MVKQFRVPRQDKAALPFELIYDKMINGEWIEQTDKFNARGSVPGNLLVSMTASMNGNAGLQAQELQRMFATVIQDDEKPRFMAILDDPDTAVPIETLGEIIGWLAEEYSNRPTSSA